jgi:flagella basal body P-ring formation protein FlgA
MRAGLMILALLLPELAMAQTVIAARTLRAGHPITEADLELRPQPAAAGFVSDPAEALGMEPRVTLYAGRPIPRASLQPPALVERNQLVTLVYRQGALEIRTEGRALSRGAADAEVRVMNLASRTTVTGRVAGPGLVMVP